MIESGYYPPGAEFASKAPWNEPNLKPVKVNVCISQTLHKNTTIKTTDYMVHKCGDCEKDIDGNFIATEEGEYDFSNSDLVAAYHEDDFTILELLDELKQYIEEDLANSYSKTRKDTLKKMLKACENWQLDEEEVIQE